MGAGVLETRELKSVTAGIWQRGRWDVIWLGGDKRELKVQVVKDSVVDGGEMLKLELVVPGTEPFEECNLVVVEEQSLKDVSNPLALLCVRRGVVDMTGNGGLNVE